jgi:oligopeptide/dipeptide ABC transporter ATP-binding protein
MTALLEVRDLVKRFPRSGFQRRSQVHAVNGISFELERGETLGLVGESGSGKSTVARALLGLERVDGGSIRFDGQELVGLGRTALLPVRRRMQIVFQDPHGALNPRLTIGAAVAEGLEIHRVVPAGDVPGRVSRLLEEVGLDPATAERYPHEFSGGQRQRIGLARALAVEPDLLICDEPVSALDVVARAQILDLLARLQKARGLACLFIAHDLAAVRTVARRVAVMYLGTIVESGPADEVITNPLHPYARALVSAVPVADPVRRRERIVLAGDPPSPTTIPAGCPFTSRCYHPGRNDRCLAARPELRSLGGRSVACHVV